MSMQEPPNRYRLCQKPAMVWNNAIGKVRSSSVAARSRSASTFISRRVRQWWTSTLEIFYMANRIGRVFDDDVTWPWKAKVMFGAQYFENGWRCWRYRLSYNVVPVGNSTWGIKWSRARWRHMNLSGQGCHPDVFGCIYLKPLEIEALLQRTNGRKLHLANRMVT